MKRKISKPFPFFLLILVFLGLGLFFVADASAPQALSYFGDKFYFFRQQFVWCLIGIAVMFVTSTIPFKFWQQMAVPLLGATFVALLVVLIPGVGVKSLGARRWINLGFTSFQPSEVMKLSLILYLSTYLKNKDKLMPVLVVIGATLGLIMLQPDLGTATIIAGIFVSILFASGVNLQKLFSILALGLVAGSMLIAISPYRRDRVKTFLSAGHDPLGSSYHIRQVLLSLGSGGIFGVGIGASKQKYLYLPEAGTDSIFAVIAEEFGFLGSIVIVSLYLFMVYQIFRVSTTQKDKSKALYLVGLASWVGTQMLINVGSMAALFPLTGVPLPLFSYGGTSLVIIMFSFGILLGITRYERN